MIVKKSWESAQEFFHLLLFTRFPAAGLSTSHILTDWLDDWSSTAEWARLLITNRVAAFSITQNALKA